MKMIKWSVIGAVAFISVCLISTSVWAGSRQQHRWEGVAIGLGAVIAGSALIDHHAYGYQSGPPVVFSFNYQENRRRPLRSSAYRKPHYGGHPYSWRPHYRGNHDQGCRPHGNYNDNRHQENWSSHDRGHDGDQRSQRQGSQRTEIASVESAGCPGFQIKNT